MATTGTNEAMNPRPHKKQRECKADVKILFPNVVSFYAESQVLRVISRYFQRALSRCSADDIDDGLVVFDWTTHTEWWFLPLDFKWAMDLLKILPHHKVLPENVEKALRWAVFLDSKQLLEECDNVMFDSRFLVWHPVGLAMEEAALTLALSLGHLPITKARSIEVIHSSLSRDPFGATSKAIETILKCVQEDMDCKDVLWYDLTRYLPPLYTLEKKEQLFRSDDILEIILVAFELNKAASRGLIARSA